MGNVASRLAALKARRLPPRPEQLAPPAAGADGGASDDDQYWYATGRRRPALRGLAHAAALALSPAWVYAMLSSACGVNGEGHWNVQAVAAATLSVLATALVFATSSNYHLTMWRDVAAEHRAMNADYLAISGILAFGVAPCYVLLAPRSGYFSGWALLGYSALAGIATAAVSLGGASHAVRTAVVAGQGCLCAALVSAVSLDAHETSLLQIICVLCVAGSLVFGLKVPPADGRFARWFDYHDVFHALVTAAFACGYILTLSVIARVQRQQQQQ